MLRLKKAPGTRSITSEKSSEPHLGLGDLYPVVPEQFPDIAVQFCHQRTVVDGGGKFRVPLDLRGGAEGGGNSLGNLLQTALGMHPHLLIERPDGTGEVAVIGDNIFGCAGNELSDGEDQRLLLVAFPAVDGLQRNEDMRQDIHRVDAVLGTAPWAPLPWTITLKPSAEAADGRWCA